MKRSISHCRINSRTLSILLLKLHFPWLLFIVALCIPTTVLGTHIHFGSSPFSPPDPADTTFSVDQGPGLDTGCIFRSGGPLVFDIEITRAVGDVKSDGTLQDPDTLKENGVVSQTATLTLPAFDVDYDINDRPSLIELGVNPERDRIKFNGVEIKRAGTSEPFLVGQNNVWIKNVFEVPIEIVRFPEKARLGETPARRKNTITIDIDQANIGNFIEELETDEFWCTAIDWAALEFQAIAPILLVHGTNANSQTWVPEVTGFLTSKKIPFSNDIDLTPNGTIDGNAQQLRDRVKVLADSFGAKNVHLVAHSKGGLDSRRFLGTYYQPNQVQVLSLFTLSSPHHGTILSDIARAARTLNDPTSDDPDVKKFIDGDFWARNIGNVPRDPALGDQTVGNMATFNINNPFPGGILFFTFGADADLDNDGAISEAEAAPLLTSSLFVDAAEIGSLMYRILGNVSAITVTRMTNLFGVNEWHVVAPVATSTFQLNDIVVTANSAQHPSASHLGTVDRNHSNIKDATIIQKVLDRIENKFPVLPAQ